MNPRLSRRHLLRTGAALCVSLSMPAVRACEFFAPNLRIFHPWTRASAEGDTFAVICMTIDEVTVADRLIGVESPVATGAELIGDGVGPGLDLLLPKGGSLQLSEAGIHIRLTGLKEPLLLGRVYPLTLTFEKGGVVKADVDVDYESNAA